MNVKPETLAAYRKERADHPERSAAQSLIAARYALRVRGRSIPQYAGDSVRLELPRGEYILIALESDTDADISERLQFTTYRSRDADHAGNNGASDGWQDRAGRVLHDVGGRYRIAWEYWEDNYGFAQFWEDGKRNNSRHAAWLRARRLVADSFAYYQEVREAGYVGYVVTLHDANGREVSEESCWGFEACGDYAGEEAADIADHMAGERAKFWTREIDATRELARDIRTRWHALAVELRALEHVGPAICDTLRGALSDLRAQHSAAVRIIAGA